MGAIGDNGDKAVTRRECAERHGDGVKDLRKALFNIRWTIAAVGSVLLGIVGSGVAIGWIAVEKAAANERDIAAVREGGAEFKASILRSLERIEKNLDGMGNRPK